MDAAAAYLSRHSDAEGEIAEVDCELANLIAQGLLDIDPEDDTFMMTPAGHVAFQREQADRWKTTLASWPTPAATN